MNSQGPVYISEGFDSTEQGERKELGSDDPRVNVPSLVASFVMNPPRGSFITPTQDLHILRGRQLHRLLVPVPLLVVDEKGALDQ